jgi:NAD(P)-dependent dehydrogenase (short-subunit alcohol dehydrogenase family)
MSFENQVALISGGASGIGAATVRDFAKQGAAVAIGDTNGNAARELAEELMAKGAKAIAVVLDVANPESAAGFVATAKKAFGKVDILVNCAAIREIKSFSDIAYEDWRQVIDVNLTGTFLVGHAFARQVIDDKSSASIVNIASAAGILGVPDRPAYVASKHGVIGLTKAMAIDLGPHKIRVNVVAPGSVRTPLTDVYYSNAAVLDKLRASHPIGRTGEPHDISAAILFLSSAAAGFITGAILSADGGYVTGKGW